MYDMHTLWDTLRNTELRKVRSKINDMCRTHEIADILTAIATYCDERSAEMYGEGAMHAHRYWANLASSIGSLRRSQV